MAKDRRLRWKTYSALSTSKTVASAQQCMWQRPQEAYLARHGEGAKLDDVRGQRHGLDTSYVLNSGAVQLCAHLLCRANQRRTMPSDIGSGVPASETEDSSVLPCVS